VLVNSVLPTPWSSRAEAAKATPDVLRWAGSSLERTARAMPDASEQVQRWACSNWRDESGAVMREVRAGIDAPDPRCRTLFVVSEDDDDVPATQQTAWADSWRGSKLVYQRMSHVGPLLGVEAERVAQDVARWLQEGDRWRSGGGADDTSVSGVG